ncbi:hypothetical protein YWA314_07149 [Yersinia enterocolitica subsp. enterocolitica WA-314]|nr:hypothetical protein YWA314_07149 [Yersinia enterocolitica subsp. enterocolitica WA-314]
MGRDHAMIGYAIWAKNYSVSTYQVHRPN